MEQAPAIATATQADLDELMRLENVSFLPEDVFSRRQYRDLLANPNVTIRVICASGARENARRLLASAVLLRRARGRAAAPPSARLYSIAVDPCCRGHGLGARLLADVIELCRRERVGRLSLEVRSDNAAAIGLYRRFGFDIEHDLPDYYGPGRHGVKMSLGLHPGA